MPQVGPLQSEKDEVSRLSAHDMKIQETEISVANNDLFTNVTLPNHNSTADRNRDSILQTMREAEDLIDSSSMDTM